MDRDIWVLAGQSNMQGLGELAEATPPHPEITMFSFNRTWKPAVEPLHRFWETKDSAQYRMTPYLGFEMTREQLDAMYEELHPQNEISPVGGVGPGYFFAIEMHRLTEAPIGLIPCALGGSSLDMWSKGFADENGEPFADTLYGDMIDRIRLAEGKLRGILWYQGESDAHPRLSDTYSERFRQFVNDVRADVGDSDLPFITVQLATTEEVEWHDLDCWNRMRENQRLLAEELHNVVMVAAADLPRVDGIHLSYAAHERLGVRLARAATGFVPGVSERYTIPALAGVELLDSRKSVRIRFSGVNGKLTATVDVRALGFEVSGVEVVAAAIEPPDSIVLTLAEQIGARSEIWHGRGFEPLVSLVDEACFLMPCFGPVTGRMSDWLAQ